MNARCLSTLRTAIDRDCVLSGGALPLDVLEDDVNAWIAARPKG